MDGSQLQVPAHGPARHAPAAYLASVEAPQEIAEQIFRDYFVEMVFDDSAPNGAFNMRNAALPDDKHISLLMTRWPVPRIIY